MLRNLFSATILTAVFVAFVFSLVSCASHRSASYNQTAHVTDTTHITIFHDSVRFTVHDTTIINIRDSSIIHTKIIERFDPTTGYITDRETDKYESMYHEYIDRSSKTIDSLRRAIDSVLTNHYTAAEEQHATETKKPSGTATSVCMALIALVILLCIITYRHSNKK